jgi:GH24 family phage-related lysozyme (muramidase)
MSSIKAPSANTLKLLLDFEVGGGQKYYEKYLSNFTWPGGASGPTIGIGIDCAYYTKEELADLFNFLKKEEIELIQGAVNKTKDAGKEYTKKLKQAGIVVPWANALEIFENLTWKKFAGLAQKTFPLLEELHEDAYGAIVSLVFNRGTKLDGDSRREMRTIKELIPLKNYQSIAWEFRSMKRLWEGKGLDGLVRRREAEAKLVENAI